jgi:hypothetical protein
MSWWHTGDEEARKEIERRKMDAEKRKKGFFEFFLKVGESRKCFFCDDVNEKSFGFWRHRLKLDGDFKQTVNVTCTKGFAPCPVCDKTWRNGQKDAPFIRTHINVATLIDLTPWNRDDGTVVPCAKRPLLIKNEVYELLCGKSRKRRENGDVDGLKGYIVDITRINQKRKKDGQEMSSSIGNDFEPLFKVTDPIHLPDSVKMGPAPKQGETDTRQKHPGLIMADGTPMDLSPCNYPEMFAPRTKEEIDALFSSHRVTDGNVFGSGGGSHAPAGAASSVGY